MAERNVFYGHILHISSAVAHAVGIRRPFYSATKFAVRALAEGLRMELAEAKLQI